MWPPPGGAVCENFGSFARARTGQPFAGGCDDRLVEVVGRSLGGDVKDGEAFDLIAEEVETERLIVLGRPDVHDAAAHGDLRAMLHELLSSVPHVHQSLNEAIAFDLTTSAQHDGISERLGREHLGDGAGRGHHDTRGDTLAKRQRRSDLIAITDCPDSRVRGDECPTRATAPRRSPQPRRESVANVFGLGRGRRDSDE